MDKLTEQIISKDNLLWAWKKAKNAFSIGDIWYSDYLLCKFELNLYNEFESIISDIKNGCYKMKLLRIAPFPKGFDDDKQKPKIRQAFYVSVRDQVTWLAVCNVIGRLIDDKMPAWSYGNRIYRPAWYEYTDNEKQLVIGNYRNSNGHIYRKWKQSWPLFRKHIAATIKIMSNPNINLNNNSNKNDGNDREIINLIEENARLESEQQLPYLLDGYFKNAQLDKIYWASLDFEKFYPSLKSAKIRETIFTELNIEEGKYPLFESLMNALFDFRIDLDQWERGELEAMDIQGENYNGLPTGLLVAGFLANIGLLEIDRLVHHELSANKCIAHFRFVDDHVILSTDFDQLINWIKKYIYELDVADIGVKVGEEKTEPHSITDLLKSKDNGGECYERAKKEATLDPHYPSPLMTQTLAKVSAISKIDIDLLSNEEINQLVLDLKHLLITNFPDQEVKKETRISFASTMLSKLAQQRQFDYNKLYSYKQQLVTLKNEILDTTSKLNKNIIDNINLLISKTHTLEEIKEIIKNKKIVRNKRGITNSFLDKYNTICANINRMLDETTYEKENFNSQVYNLIYKSIKENHHKVRLWIRLVQFCHSAGYFKYDEIWALIKYLREKHIAHNLSIPFLYYIYLALIIELSWKSLNIILKENSTQEQINQNTLFIDYICSENFLNMIFKEESLDKKELCSILLQFKICIGSISFILNKKRPIYFDEFHIIDWKSTPNEWIEATNLKDINIWLFWILSNTHDYRRESPYYFWKEIIKKSYLKIEEKNKSLIIPFPDSKYISSFQKSPSDIEVLTKIVDSQGWLFEFYQTIHKKEIQQRFLNQIIKKYPNLYNNLQNKQMHTCYDWILKLQHRQSSQEDLQSSEWMTLALILQIIGTIKKGEKSVNSITKFRAITQDQTNNIYLHPANFYVNNNLFESFPSNWNDLKIFMKKKNYIKFRNKKERIIDERYCLHGAFNMPFSKNCTILYGIAILMIQFFCKEITFPWVWNFIEQNRILTRIITTKLTNNAVSSYSQLIIQSCLSARNRETQLLNCLNFPITDIKNDPPIITSLDDLEKEIRKTMKILEKNKISVEDNSPRQLIPISLIHLSNKNNPFQE